MDELLFFLKLLADPARLNIIGLLAENTYSVDELAATLKLSASTVSHHLTRLQKAGLVSAQTQQYYNIYTLHEDAFYGYTDQLTLAHLAERVHKNEAIDSEAFTRQIMTQWIKDERLQGIPSQRKHRQVVFGWLADKFEPDRRYDEDQVWDRLGEWSGPDIKEYTSLYRAMIDEKLFARTADGRWYWRTDSPLAQDADSSTMEHLPVATTPNINRYTSRRAALQAHDPEGVYANLEEEPRVSDRRRELMRLALHLKSRRPYSEAEIEQTLALFTDEAVTAVRAEMLDEKLLHQKDDGTYWRDTIS
ncbi:MAG: metalloregulator ArsR/SmtB family transcription factor [Anaerolineaceae bacterium]|nr:metalloregulator ArsR/SmtB family transcription factor [Anaerolineaceae bacterium]